MSNSIMMTRELREALHRIVVAEDVVMKYRLAALQAIENHEMDGYGEVMTEQDVHDYTLCRTMWCM
jgi:hypothetical protein